MAKAKRKPVVKKKPQKKAGPKKSPKPKKLASRIATRQKSKKTPKPMKKAKPSKKPQPKKTPAGKKILAKKPSQSKARQPRASPKPVLIKQGRKMEMLAPAPAVPLLPPPKEPAAAPMVKAAEKEKPPAAPPGSETARKAAVPEAAPQPPPKPAPAEPEIAPIMPQEPEKPKPAIAQGTQPPAAKPETHPEKPAPSAAQPPKPSAPPPATAVSPPTETGPAKPPEPKPVAGGIHPLLPALDLLPEWEDRLRLRRVIFEDGLQFFMMGKGTSEFEEAYLLLSQTHKLPHSDLEGYFLICAKDRSGKVIAAVDGHSLSDELLVIGRSYSGHAKKRELHVLLYAAALSGRNPSFVVCYTKLGDFSTDTAGRLIFFGRGLGMSALPLKTSHIIFIRRVRKELNPLSSGAEISGVLEKLKVFGELELDGHIDEFRQKPSVALVPLPTSPDSREHLHELKDVVNALSLPAGQLDAVMASLRADYVSGRRDITPEAL